VLACNPDPAATADVELAEHADPANEALPPPSSIPMCDAYRDDENTYGYCIYRYAGGMRTRAEMEDACGRAGAWEADCRHGWVAGRMQPNSGFETAELLEVCKDVPDCAFELVDFRPDPDPAVQIVRCAQHAGPYARDCAGHAMQRFWLTDPSEEDWRAVAMARIPFQDRVGYWLGVDVFCFQKSECMGDGPVRHNCQQTVANFQKNPERCPPRKQERLQTQPTNNPRQPGGQPGSQPGGQPGSQPGGQAGGQPGGQPGGQAGGQPGGQAGGQAGGQSGGQSGGQPQPR
jgi:hypothetical protein